MLKSTKSSSTKVMPVKSTLSETFTICICIYLNIKFKMIGRLVVSSSQFYQDTEVPFFPSRYQLNHHHCQIFSHD